MFKPGNEKLEAMNREELSTANRRIFMNRYLEGKDQSRSGDLDLVPHSGAFIVPNLTSPRPPIHSPGNPLSMKIVPLSSSSHELQELDLSKSSHSNASTAMPSSIPLMTSGKGLVGQLGTFVMGGGNRQNTGRGDNSSKGDNASKGDKSPSRHHGASHVVGVVGDPATDVGVGGVDGSTTALIKRSLLPVSNKESVELNVPLSLFTDEALITTTKRLEPIVAIKTGPHGDVIPAPIPSTLKEHLLTLEKLRILVVDDSAMNRKMLSKVR